jgi:hypothetical protein
MQGMDRTLVRGVPYWLTGLFLFAVLGFWPSYFSRLLDQPGWQIHFHGLVMISWFALMISQALLIRKNRRNIHRQLGKISYLIAPLVFISILALTHYRSSPLGITEGSLYFTALPIALALQFVAAYGLAIYHRRTPAVHARFMVCTALPLVPAILDRVMFFYLLPPSRVQFLPQIEGDPQYWLISWTLVDASLIALSVWDWRSRKRLNVFPVLLAIFVVLEILTMTVYSTDMWIAFTKWFFSLPLS